MNSALSDRFLSFVEPDTNGGCWLWSGCLSDGGYGLFWLGHKSGRAHRYSWSLRNGPIPDGVVICHRCDVRACVNPDHMFAGTTRDNVRDMWSKGRNALPGAKLSQEDVVEIRRRLTAGTRQTDLAVLFGVAKSSINGIARNKSWVHQ